MADLFFSTGAVNEKGLSETRRTEEYGARGAQCVYLCHSLSVADCEYVGGGGGCFCFHGRWGLLSLSLSLCCSLSLSLSVQEVPQTQTTLNVLCFRPGRGSQRGSGQAWVSLPGWSGPANVYDLNQPNPTGLFKGIENDLQELRWPGIGNQRKSRQSFKSVVALWLCFGSIWTHYPVLESLLLTAPMANCQDQLFW